MDMVHVELEAARLDREIGARVRRARKERGLTQTQLGDALSVSFQQVQKYERGTNRISSSALVLIARVLDVSPQELLGSDGAGSDIDWNLFAVEGADELLRSYRSIQTPRLQRVVLELARGLAASEA
jgi:transcriptional regulator with XRE-family HTH domain